MTLFTILLLAGAELAGTYGVCLHYSPDQPPSSTVLVLHEPLTSGETISGSFYGTVFKEARFSTNGGTPVFFAVTEDGSGEYFHTGRWADGEFRGQTYSRGREFLMPWTAYPDEDACPQP